MKAREKRPRKARATKDEPAAADTEAADGAGEELAASADDEAPAEPETDSEAASAEKQPAQQNGHAEQTSEGEAKAALSAADTDAAADESAADEGASDDAPHLQAVTESGSAPAGGIDRAHMKAVLESLIFVSERTPTAVQLARAAKLKVAIARALIEELMQDYQGHGIELIEVAGGYQFRSAPACSAFVREFVAQKPVRLTSAQLETLALIAYRQPMTRPEIDDVRGVDSGSAVRVLLERNLIKMLGRKDEPGRPLLYGTSNYFLEFFGMRSLKDLPTLREFTDLSEESRALFKRKTGEALEEGESAFVEPSGASDEQVEHISDEDLAELAREADAERHSDSDAPEAEPPTADPDPEPAGEPLDGDDAEDSDLSVSATEA